MLNHINRSNDVGTIVAMLSLHNRLKYIRLNVVEAIVIAPSWWNILKSMLNHVLNHIIDSYLDEALTN
jgi:hypothetical protein